ncbi:hypothetical protein ARMGADRAFT_1092529 [Armillaria gallica]|uniref:Uncharacterized protein n=1 Tax=Armillaria gallica TaxID=47427 RepID=A0A2H3CFP9_ARMGA|nr:hypothetical protein ARMGADRAFT_1092529 [Armillaria gallica]
MRGVENDEGVNRNVWGKGAEPHLPQLYSRFLPPYWTASAASAMVVGVRLSSTARPSVPVYRAIRVAHGNMLLRKLRDISLSRFLTDSVFSGREDHLSTNDTRDYANRNLHPALTFGATADGGSVNGRGLRRLAAYASALCLDFFSNIVVLREVMKVGVDEDRHIHSLTSWEFQANDIYVTADSLAILNVTGMHSILDVHIRRTRGEEGGNVIPLTARAGSQEVAGREDVRSGSRPTDDMATRHTLPKVPMRLLVYRS